MLPLTLIMGSHCVGCLLAPAVQYILRSLGLGIRDCSPSSVAERRLKITVIVVMSILRTAEMDMEIIYCNLLCLLLLQSCVCHDLGGSYMLQNRTLVLSVLFKI